MCVLKNGRKPSRTSFHGLAQDGHRAVREDAPVAVDQSSPGILDLPAISRTGQLRTGLDDVVHGWHLPRRAEGEQPAVGVDREDVGRVVQGLRALVHVLHPMPRLPLGAEATRSHGSDEANRVAIVQAEPIDVLGQQLRLGIRLPRGLLAAEHGLVDDGRRIQRTTCFSAPENHKASLFGQRPAAPRRQALQKATVGHDDSSSTVGASGAL
mmetsp:Transcript_147836/g.474570  ORF Transcript_147836/g.474570 Transcript_147836/m.474570 type:complete len:211 (+) Transcript_147836:200-832(+)